MPFANPGAVPVVGLCLPFVALFSPSAFSSVFRWFLGFPSFSFHSEVVGIAHNFHFIAWGEDLILQETRINSCFTESIKK